MHWESFLLTSIDKFREMCYSNDNIFVVCISQYPFRVRGKLRTPNVLQRQLFGGVQQITVSNNKQSIENHHSSKPHTYVDCGQQQITLSNNKYPYLKWS